jgi:hypothetical protein
MGSEGNVTVKFANLVKNLWSGKDAKVYPLEFLKILASYASHVSLMVNIILIIVSVRVAARCLGVPSLSARCFA